MVTRQSTIENLTMDMKILNETLDELRTTEDEEKFLELLGMFVALSISMETLAELYKEEGVRA